MVFRVHHRIGLHRLRLQEIEKSAKLVETAIEQRAVPLRLELEQLASRAPEDAYEDHMDLGAELWELESEMAQALRRALFVAAYSIVESELDDSCFDYERRHPEAVSLRDLHGKGIRRSRTYMRKVMGLKFPPSSSCWERMRSLNALRNTVVHKDSRLDPDSRRAAEGLPGFTATESVLTLSPEWLPTFLAAADSYWEELYSGSTGT